MSRKKTFLQNFQKNSFFQSSIDREVMDLFYRAKKMKASFRE